MDNNTQTPANPEKNKPNTLNRTITILLILILAVIGFQYLNREQIQTVENVNNYNSQEFNFTFQYPQSWRTEVCQDNASTLIALGDREQLVICSSDAPSYAYVLVGAVKSPYWAGTLEEQVTQQASILDEVKTENTTLNNQPAIRVEGRIKDFGEESMMPLPAGTLFVRIVAIKDDGLYQLIFQDIGNTNSTEEFDKIVESFEFTN